MRRHLAALLFLLAALGPPLVAQCTVTSGDELAKPVVMASGDCRIFKLRGYRALTVVTHPASATATLTGTGQPLDTETATIDATVYTGETGALDADYKFLIGATLTATLANLCSCINGDDDGVVCDAGTAAHPTVTCTGSTATTLTIEAITPGSGANTIATTETLTTNAWGGATLVDVTDPVVVVTRADTITETEHETLLSTITDTEPALTVFDVDWPFYLVTVTGGPARIGAVP